MAGKVRPVVTETDIPRAQPIIRPQVHRSSEMVLIRYKPNGKVQSMREKPAKTLVKQSPHNWELV